MMERESSQSIMTKSQDDEDFSEDDVTPRKSTSSTDSAEEITKRYLLSKCLRGCWLVLNSGISEYFLTEGQTSQDFN